MVARPDLSNDILFEIFSRLPTISVGKFRCLSKTWRNLLSTPHFIKSHLAREKARHQYLIIIPRCCSTRSVEIIKINDTVSKKISLPGRWNMIIGSCNGLVLLLSDHDDDNEELLLVNPITLEQAKIPISPLALRQSESFSLYGFGHDRVRDDYKVVKLSYELSDQPGLVYTDIFVDVYYVKTGVWKRLNNLPNSSSYDHFYTSSRALVNGAIHWLAASTRSGRGFVITAFDLVNETFFEIPIPVVGVDVKCFSPHFIVVLGGCLCLMDCKSNVEWANILVMKEYGVAESWMKFRVYGYGNFAYFKPLSFIGDDCDAEFMSVVEARGLVVYNPKVGIENLVALRARGKFEDGGTFVESLVSLASLRS
ncbi:hypothetical protein CASFOL_005120 [Castilleja foliolosa]|uniref:F-box domain-containing protein n=1 Tax=Castilleja foliolosa TaxID=1961234 RepID=A0ABD3E336_9LAMI